MVSQTILKETHFTNTSVLSNMLMYHNPIITADLCNGFSNDERDARGEFMILI